MDEKDSIENLRDFINEAYIVTDSLFRTGTRLENI
jgi:hypothetical protein